MRSGGHSAHHPDLGSFMNSASGFVSVRTSLYVLSSHSLPEAVLKHAAVMKSEKGLGWPGHLASLTLASAQALGFGAIRQGRLWPDPGPDMSCHLSSNPTPGKLGVCTLKTVITLLKYS